MHTPSFRMDEAALFRQRSVNYIQILKVKIGVGSLEKLQLWGWVRSRCLLGVCSIVIYNA